jgi:hypothetical protein
LSQPREAETPINDTEDPSSRRSGFFQTDADGIKWPSYLKISTLVENHMDRRQFLQTTTGAAVASAVSPMASATMRSFLPGLAGSDAEPMAGIKSPWLNSDPTRIGWFALRDLDSASDPQAVVDSCAKINVNCIVSTAGGNVAFYPTKVPFHERSPSLGEDKDFFGDLCKAAKQRNIRIGSRFDFSRQSKAALDAHPEWFFRHTDGSAATDNTGCYGPCLNTDFYHVQAIKIISEVMDLYKPEIVFVNNFVNSGGGSPGVRAAAGDVDNTICHCESCKADYQNRYGKSLPTRSNAEYVAFMKGVSDRSNKIIADTLHMKWPGTLLINADNDHGDGLHSESRISIAPRQPWPYSSSEAINRRRTSYPEKVAINVCIGYSGNLSRLVVMPQEEMKVHLYQAGAHGSPVTYAFTGTPLTQDDKRELDALEKFYAWHAANSDLYSLQANLARVLLMVEPEVAPRRRNAIPEETNKGVYRMLTEAHIPVAVSESPRSMQNASGNFDLVIVTEGAPTEGVKEYVENGGRALFINQPPSFGLPEMVRQQTDVGTGYVEIRDPNAFPSLAGVRYATCSGSYAQTGETGTAIAKFLIYPDEKGASLTFVAPMVENPVEFALRDLKQTEVPALLTRNVGKGRITFVPWDIGGLYTRGSVPIHAEMFIDIVDSLLPKRQIKSSAHPSVEMVLMNQPDKRRTILHLINNSGQLQNGYVAPVPFHSVDIDLAGSYSTAKARMAGADLKIAKRDGRSVLTLPVLNGYEAIVLT